jgi:hypothetical protein
MKETTMTRESIRNRYLEHAALTQLHRWYQIYENPKILLEHQLDILDPEVTVRSGLGEAKGHRAYSERIRQIPKDWNNAHIVRDTRIDIPPDGTIRLSADVTYLNQGMMADGAIRSADLVYTTTLGREGRGLPKFTTIEIAQQSEGSAERFEDFYPHNRLLSLAHYWLFLIEDPTRDPEPVREILTGDFSLHFSSGTISDFEDFKQWLAGPGSQVTASTHVIGNVSHRKIPGDRARLEYGLSMDFDWEGILPDGNVMTAKTRHSWTIVDDPTERFARIKTIDVDVIRPFEPKVET